MSLASQTVTHVTRLISDAGRTFTFKKQGASGTAYAPTITYTETAAVKGALQSYASRYIDGNIIQANDRRALILASSIAVTPAPGDRLLIDGDDWTVLLVRPYVVGSTTVAYSLQVRQ
jgi:hypothetical protein